MTADVELRPPIALLGGRAYYGHDGIDEWLRDVTESFADARIGPVVAGMGEQEPDGAPVGARGDLPDRASPARDVA
jgi:hypothetical protein